MEDYKPYTPNHERERQVVAAARRVMKELRSSKYLTDELRKTLSDLESHLSAIAETAGRTALEFSQFVNRFKSAEETVLSWESNDQHTLWESGPLKASKYLKSVDEILTLIPNFRSFYLDESGKNNNGLLRRADCVLELAMLRLEEELIQILVLHQQHFEPEYMSFRSSGADIVYDGSFVSTEEEFVEESSQRNSSTDQSDDYYVVDLVQPLVIPHLKSIARVMFASNYGPEFCQSYINARKYALNEYMDVLGPQKFGVEDVMKMDWTCLNLEIKKWNWMMKIIVRVYLASEKRLCDQILGNFESVTSVCFLDTSKDTMSWLLNFGEAVALGPRWPEELFSVLDMYEVVADLVLDIETLFGDETRIAFHELMKKLGKLAKTTFVGFENAIASNTPSNPFSGGGIHPITRYVMNYLKTLTEYGNILHLLTDHESIQDSNPAAQIHLQSIVSALQSSLENRSKLYKDGALQHVFLMNNVNYMVQKAKSSKLMCFLGDQWIREHIAKVQQHARSYERITWSPVLSLLRFENPLSHSPSRSSLRERCRAFSVAFELVYKSQTGWSIPDLKLREGLQISISQNVIHAYRNFVGRVLGKISDKDIKYSEDDLEKYLFHLFEGSPRSLNTKFSRKR